MIDQSDPTWWRARAKGKIGLVSSKMVEEDRGFTIRRAGFVCRCVVCLLVFVVDPRCSGQEGTDSRSVSCSARVCVVVFVVAFALLAEMWQLSK